MPRDAPAAQPQPSVGSASCFEPASSDKDAERVVAMLLKWDKVCQGHQSEKRTNDRFRFVSQAILMPWPNRDGALASPARNYEGLLPVFPGWTRNISTAGVAVVCTDFIRPAEGTRESDFVRLRRVMPESSPCAVGLFDREKRATWLKGTVLRHREFEGGLVEMGIGFDGRLTAEEMGAIPAFKNTVEQIVPKLTWVRSPPPRLDFDDDE